MADKKSIGNVNILDLRKTSAETVEGIERIKNVNLLVYSPATAPLVSRLTIQNVNATLELAQDVELQRTMGNLRISGGPAKGTATPGFYVVMGNVIVEAEPEETVSDDPLQHVAGLVVMGNVCYPESLRGHIVAKVRHIMGNLVPYPDEAELVTGKLELNNDVLSGLEEPTGYAVIGSLIALDPAAEALREKITFLQVTGRIVCSEENAAVLRTKLRGGTAQLHVVPSGYRYREGDLHLDAPTVGSLTDASIFCTGTVVIGGDVEPSELGRAISGLRSMGTILCPERLRETLKSKVDLVEDRVVFYEGELWLFDGDHTLRPSRFDYLEGKATIFVTGDLTVDPDVPPSVIADRVHRVHNLGNVSCTPDQMAAIEARLGIQEGDLVDSTAGEEEEHFDIGNANVLEL